MTTKEQILYALSQLPDDATIEDAMDTLVLLYKIQQGVEEADAGKTIPHAEVVEYFRKWRK